MQQTKQSWKTIFSIGEKNKVLNNIANAKIIRSHYVLKYMNSDS